MLYFTTSDTKIGDRKSLKIEVYRNSNKTALICRFYLTNMLSCCGMALLFNMTFFGKPHLPKEDCEEIMEFIKTEGIKSLTLRWSNEYAKIIATDRIGGCIHTIATNSGWDMVGNKVKNPNSGNNISLYEYNLV